MAHGESQLFLLHSHPGSVLHCEATCMHVDIPILTSKFHLHSLPSQTATQDHISSPLVCPPTAWLFLPQEKILGMRPMLALEADSVLLRLESSGSQISKDLSRSGRGRLQRPWRTHGTWRKGGRTSGELKKRRPVHRACAGVPFP